MNENEMNLDEPATRRDLKELEGATRRDLGELKTELSELRTEMTELIRSELANHPTHTHLDASLRQVMLHINTNHAEMLELTADLKTMRTRLQRPTAWISRTM